MAPPPRARPQARPDSDKPAWPFGEITGGGFYLSTPTTAGKQRWLRKYLIDTPDGPRRRAYPFGDRDDPTAALDEWRRVHDDLEARRWPEQTLYGVAPTLIDLCNDFLDYEQTRVRGPESATRANSISAARFKEIRLVMKWLVAEIGTQTRTTSITKRHLLEAMEGFLGMSPKHRDVRVMDTNRLIAWARERGVRFGFDSPPTEWRQTTASEKAKHKARKPAKGISRPDLHRIIAAADPGLRAWVLLGVNCGYEPLQIASVRVRDIDFEACAIKLRRGKTLSERWAPLWPETMAAIRASIVGPRDPDALAWTNAAGNAVVQVSESGGVYNSVSRRFRTLSRRLEIGATFYWLRHVFMKAAEAARDDEYRSLIVGHRRKGTKEHYLDDADEERLHRITDVVRTWLFYAKAAPDHRWSGVVNPDAAQALERDELEYRLGARSRGDSRASIIVGGGQFMPVPRGS